MLFSNDTQRVELKGKGVWECDPKSVAIWGQVVDFSPPSSLPNQKIESECLRALGHCKPTCVYRFQACFLTIWPSLSAWEWIFRLKELNINYFHKKAGHAHRNNQIIITPPPPRQKKKKKKYPTIKLHRWIKRKVVLGETLLRNTPYHGTLCSSFPCTSCVRTNSAVLYYKPNMIA